LHSFGNQPCARQAAFLASSEDPLQIQEDSRHNCQISDILLKVKQVPA